MTPSPADAHCHPGAGRAPARCVCAAAESDWPAVALAGAAGDIAFFGVHPYFAGGADPAGVARRLRETLAAHPRAGVGEIGLDRLRDKSAVPAQMPLFAAQLKIAAEMRRPVTLHGAKAWGRAVEAARPFAGRIPLFIFHGFSRAGGLVEEIVRMNGYFGVGPAILNDHAANYRALVRSLPRERLLVETDAPHPGGEDKTAEEVAEGLAAALGADAREVAETLEANFKAVAGWAEN